ncbi:DUF1682 domain-containing protein [Escherichia coli]|nr:DUF1682 domain-containing protein [Escherichia coli]EFL5600506.1 DUF1682 domain-containing protein [Escherichia coli]EGK5685449.1 DUF1682 domain-containing protein [Escherichia coli]
MAYPIELNITDVDHDKQTLKVQGLKVSFKYFEEIIITPILNSQAPSWGVHILTQLAAAGLRTHIWPTHYREAALAIQAEAEAKRQRDIEAQQQRERMESMSATPEQIQKDNEEKARNRQAEIARARSVANGYF